MEYNELFINYQAVVWSFIAHLRSDLERDCGVDMERWGESWSRLQNIMDDAEANIPRTNDVFWDMVDGNIEAMWKRLAERIASMSEEERNALYERIKKINNGEL